MERYGSPETLVTDGGGVFRARQAQAVYEALGIAKHEIERGRPWQNYVETTFNVQRRMADWHFAEAESWPEPLRLQGYAPRAPKRPQALQGALFAYADAWA